MAYIKNTDYLVEGSSNLFFSNGRAKSAVQSDLDSLQSQITSEQSARQSADTSLAGRLNIVEGNATVSGSIEKAKADAKAYADEKVAALVNSAPAVLDTLKELSDALGGDQNFAVTVANQIGAVDDKVDQEISDRQAAVSSEQGRAQAAESALDGRLDVIEGSGEGSVSKAEQDAKDYASGLVSAEESARMAADVSLSNRVSSLEADPTTKTYVDGIQSALDSRLDILEQDETTKAYVDQQVAAEQSARQSAVSAEESARQSADQALDGRLDVLESDPTTKTYVDGKVATEKTRAEGAESALSGRVASLEADPTTKTYVDGIQSALDGRLDALELDPVSKTYVDGAKSDLQGQITAEVSARQSAVSSEASARQSADQALDARLDALELDPVSKTYVDGEVSDLQGQINQEISNRQSAVSGEQSARQSADSALDSRLDALELDPVSKTYVDGEVSDLQGQVNTEKGRVDAILSASQADKDSFAEIVSLINSVDTANDSAFAGYVLSNNAALAQEVSDRQAGDSALDGRLDVLEGADSVVGSVAKALKDAKAYADAGISSEASSRSSADTTLQSNINGLFDSKSTSNLSEGSNLYYTQARFDSAFGLKSTTNLSEGSNLYYTQARFNSALAAKSTSDLAEGSNLYHTVARAKAAAVVNSSAGSETDQAMSVSSAKSYIDAADALRLKLDGTNSMTGVLNFTGASGKNITWGTDGGGNIGASGANRPDNIYAKTSVTSSGKAVFTQSNAANPGYTFGGATNSGMYYDTNLVGISVAGSAALTCSAGVIIANKVLAVNGGMGLSRTAVAANLTMAGSETLLGVTSTAAARTISLPNATNYSGRQYMIKDESGGASATNYIRIQPGTAGQTIDGASYYDIKVAYEGVFVYSNGSNWFIM
jgi:hypothetical protein